MPESLNTSHCESSDTSRIDQMEALLLERMTGIANSVAALQPASRTQGSQTSCNNTNSSVVQYQALSARLASLEESVARLCTLLGRLDQEFQIHRNASGHHEQ